MNLNIHNRGNQLNKNCTLSTLILMILPSLICNIQGAEKTEYKTKSFKDISYINEPTTDEYRKKMSKLDLYLPERTKGFPTLVYFHGGGLNSGSRGGPIWLVKNGVAVVAVEYRLYPKCKHPEYIEDCAAATAWVFKNIAKYGGNTDRIFIGGYSAGGYLTAMLAMDKKYLQAEGVDADNLAGALFQSAQMITHAAVRKKLGYSTKQGVCDENSPMYHIRQTPFPVILQCGNDDYPSRQQENKLFESMMIRYAEQSRDKVEYCEYTGTHGSLPKNEYFKKDTEWFILKNAGLSCPKRQKEPAKKPGVAVRKYNGNFYVSVAGVENGEISLNDKIISPEKNSNYKLSRLPNEKSLRVVDDIPITIVPEVAEYVLKDGVGNSLSFDNGVRIWKDKGILQIKVDKKISKIKTPVDGQYYTGDGVEIFVDRTPLKNITENMNRSVTPGIEVRQYLFTVKPDSKGKSMKVLNHSQHGCDITEKSKAELKSKTTDTGYTLHIKIPLSEVSPLSGEGVIGFNVQVNQYDSGKQEQFSICNSTAPSYKTRLHYPLFKITHDNF